MKKEKTEEQRQKERDYAKARYQLTKDKKKLYYEKNKEKINNYNITYNKNYRIENQEKIKEYNKIHQKEKEEHYKKYRKNKYNEDSLYKLKQVSRNFISKSFRKNGFTKTSRTHEMLGCSFEEFKIHLESLWKSWMNWDNYGNPKDGVLELNKTWDIDHIIPLSNAITIEDVITLNHYTNLQPLCSYINRNIKRGQVNIRTTKY